MVDRCHALNAADDWFLVVDPAADCKINCLLTGTKWNMAALEGTVAFQGYERYEY